MSPMIAWRVAALLALVLAAPAAAQTPAVSYETIARQIAGGFLAPAYARIATAADANAAAWRHYCKDGADLGAVKAAHKDLALAFAEVQAFTIGPMGQN